MHKYSSILSRYTEQTYIILKIDKKTMFWNSLARNKMICMITIAYVLVLCNQSHNNIDVVQ
jgi:hypothetical protein